MPGTLTRTRRTQPGRRGGAVAAPRGTGGRATAGPAEALPAPRTDPAGRTAGALSVARAHHDGLARLGRFAWALALGFSVLVAPSYAADVPRPAWLDVLSVILLVGIVAALPLALRSARLGWLVYAALAGVGVAIGIGCRDAHHHAPGWWATEVGLFAAVAGLSLACAVAAPRRRT